MRPATLAEQARRLIPRLDPHIRDASLGLPLWEVLRDDPLHLPLAANVIRSDRCVKGLLTPLGYALFGDPLNAVEALLEDIIGTRYEVALFPLSKSVTVSAIGIPVITANCRDLDTGALGIQRVY